MIAPTDILSARILVVDDAPANVLLLERILHGAGYTAVATTTDPRAVCDLYREHRYDLILLDLLMPGLDGFQVMQGLQAVETEGYLPVLVLTAHAEHKLRALQAGAKDFLSKPFDQVEVLTRIHNMLEVRLLLRESRLYSRLLEQYDQVTGLPNRTLYRDLLAKALDRADALHGLVSVLVVAIDRFKDVNDTLGRVTGDALLRRVGHRLVGCLGPMDAAARLEGDAFGLMAVTFDGDPRSAGRMAHAVQDALRTPLECEGHEVPITASIGIAVAPTDAPDADALMKCADTALHAAKDAGRDTYRFYSAAMNARALESLELEQALRSALERGEFVLHYQPQLRLASGEWSGVEALLRWERPGHGLVLPAEFLGALEETELIVPVGTWVIAAACRQIRAWADSGVGPTRVAVNVSGQQIRRAGFAADVARALRESAIEPALLDLELTEGALLPRRAETDDVLRELQALGVRLVLDDFGTGYSSLAHLTRVPIGALKIDVGVMRDVPANADAAALTVAVINMARTLKMTVIAEGVETEPQLDFLREHDCDEIQGFYVSRPLPADELALLREQRRAGAPRGAPVGAS